MQAHPVDKDEKDSLSDSFGFTSNEVSIEYKKKIPCFRGRFRVENVSTQYF